MKEQNVWSELLRRCQNNFATDSRAAAYLRENGVTGLEGAELFRAGVANPRRADWARFRILHNQCFDEREQSKSSRARQRAWQ